MHTFFRYNWMVRDEWFDLCSKLPYEELTKERVGGIKTILGTLFHIVVVEESWMKDIKGIPVTDYEFSDFQSVDAIKTLSDSVKKETEKIVLKWDANKDYEMIMCPLENGQMEGFTYGEILRHLIAHEIHHIGQLSIWARKIGVQPISANLIRRGLFKKTLECDNTIVE